MLLHMIFSSCVRWSQSLLLSMHSVANFSFLYDNLYYACVVVLCVFQQRGDGWILLAGDGRIYRDKKFCTRKLVTLCSASHTAQIHGHSQPLGPSESWGVALPGGSLPWIGSKRQAPGQSGAGALSWGRVSRGAAGGASQGSCSPSSGPPFSRRLLPLVLPARRPDGTWPPPLWQQQDGAWAAPLRSSSGAPSWTLSLSHLYAVHPLYVTLFKLPLLLGTKTHLYLPRKKPTHVCVFSSQAHRMHPSF